MSDEIDYEALVPILMALRSEDSWVFKGACADLDPAVFFGPADDFKDDRPPTRHDAREAKKICGACEVRSTCLEFAITHNEQYGVWGGLTEKERRKIRRTRRAEERAQEAANAAVEVVQRRRRVIVRREADWR